ncbi:MAG: hypothetical protein FWC97_11030 [Treponema sp.]|nr:hypothetical protein [Treponema sp.]
MGVVYLKIAELTIMAGGAAEPVRKNSCEESAPEPFRSPMRGAQEMFFLPDSAVPPANGCIPCVRGAIVFGAVIGRYVKFCKTSNILE